MIFVNHKTHGGRSVSVEVHEATVGMNLQRMKLTRDVGMAEGVEDMDPVEGTVKIATFPACKASSSNLVDTAYPEHTIESMTFNDFKDLPAAFVNKWADAVYKLNPDWSIVGKVPQRRPSSKEEKTR